MSLPLKLAIVSVLLAAVVVAAFLIPRASLPPWLRLASPSSTGRSSGAALVTHVVDGDTFDVEIDGKTERVRMLGINTPETVKPNAPVDCYGPEASARTKKALTGEAVTLTADPTQDDRDKYGRLLRYVDLADGTDFEQSLVAGGYAYEYTFRSAYARQAEFRAAQADAKAAGAGLWGSCPDAGKRKK